MVHRAAILRGNGLPAGGFKFTSLRTSLVERFIHVLPGAQSLNGFHSSDICQTEIKVFIVRLKFYVSKPPHVSVYG